jgi:hypothetical protein
MPDLLIIVPTRGRPGNALRLIRAVEALRELDTDVFLGVDEDDPERPAYGKLAGEKFSCKVPVTVKPRMGLADWTNYAARHYAGEYPFLASFGDDHVPRTRGFDRKLVRAIKEMGGTGFSYPHDGAREDVPEAVVMSSDIVRALGWMCVPGLEHYFIDDAWGNLGRHAGCLRYLRAVAVDHVRGGTDATYSAASGKLAADMEAYHAWRAGQMSRDIEVIRKLRAAA